MSAQRLLVERGKTDVVPALCALAKDQRTDRIGLNAAAIHALWTLHGLGAIEASARPVSEALESALKHPSAGVRRAALAVAPRDVPWGEKVLSLLKDSDAEVRLAALLAMSEMPVSDAAGAPILELLKEPRNAQDRWIPDAATCAAARHDAAFLKAALAADAGSPSGWKPDGTFSTVLQRVTAHYADRGPTETVLGLLGALDGRSAAATPVLDGLLSGWPRDKAPVIGEAEARTLSALMQSLPEASRSRLLRLAKKWGREDLFASAINAVVQTLNQTLADAALSVAQRVVAAKQLLGLRDNTESVQLILGQVNLLAAPDLAAGLINAVADSRQPETGNVLVGHWGQLTPAARRAQVGVLLRRVEWAAALLDAVESGAIRASDLAMEQRSQLKLNLNSTLAERAEKLSTTKGAVTADRAEIVNQLLPLAKEPGEPARGKEVFTVNCAVCHTFAGQGGKVGPELTGIGARDRGEILIDILDPNRSVEANYRLWNVATKDGETYSGRLESETQTTVELLDATGHNHIIQRKDIDQLHGSQLSIMPTGFEALPRSDLRALLAFLTQLPK
jgi:putative heme-binding domain-containing protein